ncbi:molybdopterin-guanine dinucleotide biosynthesis protein [Nesterenkonia sp. MY13]|uniref:Molybdopterin-guanine dinucleotide biosynthesis protein n=1 Tax=Nesterenkonia sedimenti TaxID=1463632 RepID=A0A7X8YDB9_9MICC|nr:DUF6457 domain-containing protein [Nesterenkonia sedimenti]NLS08977.1 molybdopterin-guanine dinucleotide biosynthesis protein [Nesterenkonia sedimenti]
MSDDARLATVEEWARELARALEVEETALDIDAILSLAGEAAHTVVRPAAPVTTFIIGYVAGLAEATGQASFTTAQAAASGVARRLLQERDAVQQTTDDEYP